MSLLAAFETLCWNIEVVRNALVELEQVPQEEMSGLTCRMIVEEARPLLAMHVRKLRDRIQPGTRRFFTTDLDAMRRELTRSSARGLARSTLDEALGVDVFQSVARTAALEQGQLPSPQYQFPLPANPLFIRIALLPPGEFLRLVLEHLITEVERPEHYQSLYAFDLHVSQQFLALWYVAWQSTTSESSDSPEVRMGRIGLDPTENDPEEERLRFWRR